MICLEAYRVSVGCFNHTAQLGLKSIFKNMTLESNISPKGLTRLLALTRLCFVICFLSYFALVSPSSPKLTRMLLLPDAFYECPGRSLILSGDIELNPGSSIVKVVSGTFAQSNFTQFGPFAGSQCMCNALWSICFFTAKNPRFCSSSDLDTILNLLEKYKN